MINNATKASFQWDKAPDELKLQIILQMPLASCLIMRVVSQSLKNLIDTYENYWTRKIEARFGNYDGKIKVLESCEVFNSLISSSPKFYFQIYTKLLEPFYQYRLDYNLTKRYEGGVKYLVASTPSTIEDQNLFFIDEKKALRQVKQEEYFSDGKNIRSEELPLEEGEKSVCLFQSKLGLIVGTEKGMIYLLDKNIKNQPIRLFKNPIVGQIKSIEVSSKGQMMGLIVHIGSVLNDDVITAFFIIDFESINETAVQLVPDPSLLRASPKFAQDLLVLCPLYQGGIQIYDLSKTVGLSKVLLPQELLLREYSIASVGIVGKRIIFSTKEGRVGWINLDDLSKESEVTWAKFQIPHSVCQIKPLGGIGFFLKWKSGDTMVGIFKADGECILNAKMLKNIENPIWLEDGRILFHFSDEEHKGLYSINYSIAVIDAAAQKIKGSLKSLVYRG